MYDLVIKNGTVVSPEQTFAAHVLVKEGRIAGLIGKGELPPAREVFDAQGLHVLPGIIDIHVHFRDPGVTYKEDFGTGSQAAVCGGVTTVVDMPNVNPPTAGVEAFNLKLAAARAKSFCDFGIIAVVFEENIGELNALAEAGVVGFKIFMGETVGSLPSPTDGAIIEAMKIIAGTGLRVGVHAENRTIIEYYTGKLKAAGRTDPVAHVEARPNIAEAECIARAIMFAEQTRCKLHIYHMSSREGVDLVRKAKDRGVDVSAESGPHYLTLDHTHMDKVGSMLKMNPPVRSLEDQKRLREGLLDGTVEAIATDHSPHTLEEKTNEDIWKAIPGFCGVETSVPLMLTQVNQGWLTLNQYVKVTSAGPAKVFGMYPQKGSLMIGADADFTIVDLAREGEIKAANLHSKNKVTPFDGFPVRGMPVATIIRGRTVMKEGRILGEPGGELVRPVR